ncbi:MAG: tRNA-specific 2-thiouridylase [bacterium P3]|nr:MAG: tRNA-specific 2-thiouridylase [bacterium P3]KWW40516.1 MAG: tRNA-specific 2-thiouridylase [bacterium F083]
MNIAALVSGGVDSSVAVHLLKEQGCTPDIFYIRIGAEDDASGAADRFDCPAEEDIELTSYIARKYGCRFEVVDLHREYWDNVVSYTINAVRRGLTPNPDIMCNKLIKFGAFEQRCGKDYDYTATGHYATTAVVDGVPFLATAKDAVKDQTDFLSQLSFMQLRKLMFPIGHLLKNEVRALAAQAALPSAMRKDSQGICFLGKINYNDFLRRYLGEREGKIVELGTGRVLGTHRGYWFHTIGQRKGLFLSGGPWFVVKKDIDENILYVSQGYNPDAQYGNRVDLIDFHYLSADLWSERLDRDGAVEVKFKIRHTPDFAQGRLIRTPEGYTLHSDIRLQGIAAGQYATVYDSDAHLVVASGQIANSLM